jgi:DNA-binding transcriptional regulator YiaG
MAAKREQRLRKSQRKIGIALMQARRQIRMSQGELGRQCGVALRTMSRWETVTISSSRVLSGVQR